MLHQHRRAQLGFARHQARAPLRARGHSGPVATIGQERSKRAKEVIRRRGNSARIIGALFDDLKGSVREVGVVALPDQRASGLLHVAFDFAFDRVPVRLGSRIVVGFVWMGS